MEKDCLIKSLLTSLSLYFIFFFKIPTRVIREINKLQTDFLWGGSDDERKICWVSWVKIFQEKEEGGLGVKSLKEFNQALLAKWRWRMTCC